MPVNKKFENVLSKLAGQTGKTAKDVEIISKLFIEKCKIDIGD